MTTEYFHEFGSIADEMNRTRASSGAEISYDVFADALVWSDEYPDRYRGRRKRFDCVKLLLRYRTTLILGDPDPFFEPFWDEARELFPLWAGFDAARQCEDEQLRSIHEQYHRKATEWIESLDQEREKTCCLSFLSRPRSEETDCLLARLPFRVFRGSSLFKNTDNHEIHKTHERGKESPSLLE